jgi:hypothetical protein
MVSLNGFSVKVPECLSETSENYVVMRHGQQYSLKLSNHHKEDGHGKPCDVEVYIDDEFCGSYRVESGQNIILERPEHSNQKFTAYRIDSEEAKIAKIDHNASMGLIRAVFRPGRKKYVSRISQPAIVDRTLPGVYTYAVSDWDTISYDANRYSSDTSDIVNLASSSSYTSRDLVGGGTGLSGQSNQEFNEVDSLDYDEPATSIYLRLAFEKEESGIKPLKRIYSATIPNPL